MPNFRLTLEYDGREFEGWQAQSHGRRTVQGVIEEALQEIAGAPIRIAGAGRTDSGVHAEGQVASVAFETRLDAAELLRALNGHLPSDVAVVAARVVEDDFHARFSARGKRYAYRVWNHPIRSPLRGSRWLSWPAKLDAAAMGRAARAFEGRRDFASLQAAGSGVEDTVRTLRLCELTLDSPAELVFEVEGDGFLRHMVRNLVGTLLEVGSGRREPESIGDLLEARDRRLAGPTAPANGLTLVQVFY